jgi:hypothetical protein
MDEYNPFQGFYSQAGDFPSFQSQPLSFNLSPTTEDYISKNPLTEGINMPSSSMVVGRPQAENTAQTGKRQSNYIQDAHDAVMDLMKGGKAITAPRGSAMESAFQPEKYSRIERDIRGNIIGATGRMQLDPYTGAPIGQIAPSWKAGEGGLGKPLTPGLDALAAQNKDKSSIAKAKANQEQYAQSIKKLTGYKKPDQPEA